ncbi:unnamed protein product [Amoebophrya sp. A25]|nr:unnamed protein product [Amoebophrya sp. A25]|eukprot:GSA25T00020435001.1
MLKRKAKAKRVEFATRRRRMARAHNKRVREAKIKTLAAQGKTLADLPEHLRTQGEVEEDPYHINLKEPVVDRNEVDVDVDLNDEDWDDEESDDDGSSDVSDDDEL